MVKNTSEDAFNDAAAYERYIGRWSRLVAPEFVDWLAVPSGSAWLDVGAGTGILTQAILERTSPQHVVGIDLSAAYLMMARQTITDDRVQFKEQDASELVFDAEYFDVAVAGLVLNFVPLPEATVHAMRQAVREAGTVAAYVWDYESRMEMVKHFWDAARRIDPSSSAFNAGTHYSLCNPEKLYTLFTTAGLNRVEVIAIDVQTVFVSFDDFWFPFLSAQGSVSKYLRSLDEHGRETLRKRLLEQLPVHDDQSIHLMARAWAVKGTR